VLKLLNPWAILAVVLAIVGAGGYGIHLGRGLEVAARAKEMTLQEKLQHTIAEEVSKIKPVNRTRVEKVETITREVPVYRDCRHDPAVLGLLNDLLTAKRTLPAGEGVVPAVDAVAR
jgi:hypothetical protein